MLLKPLMLKDLRACMVCFMAASKTVLQCVKQYCLGGGTVACEQLLHLCFVSREAQGLEVTS
jgi:hypothetical protein